MSPFVLPWPPSVNRYWRCVLIGKFARVLLSSDGRKYKRQVRNRAVLLPKFGDMDRLSVEITLHPPNRVLIDIDNRAKAVFDALQDAGVFQSDNQIDRLEITRGERIKDGRIVVWIERIDDWQHRVAGLTDTLK